MAQGHFHVGIYQPDGPGEQWVPLCRCVSFFSPKMPSRTLRKGPAVTNPLGFEVSAMFREKLSSLSVRSTCNHLQVSAVHDQPPPEPEGTIFEMATLVSLHKLCKQHSILVDKQMLQSVCTCSLSKLTGFLVVARCQFCYFQAPSTSKQVLPASETGFT